MEEELKHLEKLEDKNIDVETLKQSMGLKNNVTIFVRGITKETTEKDVRDLFQEYGKIKQVSIPMDYQTR